MLTAAAVGAVPASTPVPIKGATVIQAEAATLAPGRAEVVEQGSFKSKQGVSLTAGASSNVGAADTAADLTFRVQAAKAGRYLIRTHAATDAAGAETMRKARSKHESMRLMIAVGASRPTKRVIFVPWSRSESCRQTTGKFDLDGRTQEIRVWLPEGVRLDYVEVRPYVPPKVAAAAAAYQPAVVPPASRPRIWVNEESLPGVKANLVKGENAPLWKVVQERAAKPFVFKPKPGTEAGEDRSLERAAVAKAFVYLMQGDETLGREAVALTRDYLAAVEFGNLLDITREIGRAIYAAARVYDWCYDLMSPEDRESIRTDLMRLADDMEIGWPPFRQMIVNGHGNEAQVNRDLLCMAIAIYDEDPVPYRYCAYRILEELVPMRAFEYQSPRHNQGVSYGPYRFGWDMHAATLFQRMTGKRVFDDNIADVCQFWFYMRLPNGETLRDGDGFASGRRASLGTTALLCAAYVDDPVIKGDFERQGGLKGDPILVLLLNDPDLKAAKGFESLPLTLDFGPVLGSMVARTGWNMGRNLSDVVVEMKGGGYHFGNHQHSDAGSFQIYYRGLQAADLGQYHFYGTPYDYNFCKRSISHSMMLVVDPEETFGRNASNDGGTRFVRSCPRTAKQTQANPLFANGTKVSADFGPSRQRPFYSVFSVDLKSAYSKKIKAFTRTFCFLNLDDAQTPAALIVLDNVTSAKAEFRKYWQVNTLDLPVQREEGVVLRNTDLGMGGRVDVRMLRPKASERTVEILSGKEANSVFGKFFTPPKADRPEADGHRVMFSPSAAQANDVFLTVMTMAESGAPELPIELVELPEAFVVALADRTVVLGKGDGLLQQEIQVDIKGAGTRQLLLAGLAPGPWSVRGRDETVRFNVRVEPKRNTAFLVLPAGTYTAAPEAIAGAPAFTPPSDLVPALSEAVRDCIFLDGKLLEARMTGPARDKPLLPVTGLLEALGLTVAAADGTLKVNVRDKQAAFRPGDKTFELDGLTFRVPVPAAREGNAWFLPEEIVAPLAGRSAARGEGDSCVELAAIQIPNRDGILWIEAARDCTPGELHTMLADIPGRTAYWAVEGDGALFDLVLTQPSRVSGVGITWHQGARRKARFAVETSSDGTTWKRVFDGDSSGASAEMEQYTFAPHEARHIRVHGFGNTINKWNSIVHFRPLLVE